MPGKNLHGMNTIFRSILEAEEVQSAHAVLVTGDVTDVGDRASWRYFKRTVSRLVTEQQIIVVAGNHDVCRMDWSLSFGEFFSGLMQTRQHKSLERLADNLDLIEQRSDYPWPLVLNDPHRRVMVIALD